MAHRSIRTFGLYVASEINEVFGDAMAARAGQLRYQTAMAWKRANNLPGELLGTTFSPNPAWAILLDLYLSLFDGKAMWVSDACRAAGVPQTTALRWLDALEASGLVSRLDDPEDKRRLKVALTDGTVAKIEMVIDAATASDRRLGLERLRLT